MRIWILNHYASPPDRPAGTRHYEFGRVLAGQGHQVTIFASSFSHFSRQEERLAPGERMRVQWVDGVRFVWLRTVPYHGNDVRRVANMLSYAARALVVQFRFGRPDVIVGSSVHLAAAAAAWAIGRLRRVPFVFEVRDLWPQTLIDMGTLRSGGLAARSLAAAELFLYRRASVIISLLPGAADYIAGRGIARGKIVYVPNGITGAAPPSAGTADAGPNSVTPAAGLASAGLASAGLAAQLEDWRRSGRLLAGYVGSHGEANGLDTLVRAAGELRDRGQGGIGVVFVGAGPQKQACRQLACALELDNVLFCDPVPKRAVPAVLADLDVMLFCLQDIAVFRYGLSSNKLFDYLASGRPVVAACAVPGNPVSASGGGVCIPPASPAAVADALVRLREMTGAQRRALGEQGRRWVLDNHGTAALAARFLQALERVRP